MLARMSTRLAIVLMLVAASAAVIAAGSEPASGAPIGNGETAVATAPPAAPSSESSAMPRTTAQRLRAVRPEMIFGGLATLMLISALVLAICTVVAVYRQR